MLRRVPGLRRGRPSASRAIGPTSRACCRRRRTAVDVGGRGDPDRCRRRRSPSRQWSLRAIFLIVRVASRSTASGPVTVTPCTSTLITGFRRRRRSRRTADGRRVSRCPSTRCRADVQVSGHGMGCVISPEPSRSLNVLSRWRPRESCSGGLVERSRARLWFPAGCRRSAPMQWSVVLLIRAMSVVSTRRCG
jgi:hypothetical protein